MSFFKDFKDDFAQAMNELMPESNEMYDEDEDIKKGSVSREFKRKNVTNDKKNSATKEKRMKEEKKTQNRTSTKKRIALKKKGTEEKNGIDDLDIAPEDLSDQIDDLLDYELYGDEERIQMFIDDNMEVDTMNIPQSKDVKHEKDMGLEALLDSIASKSYMNDEKQEEIASYVKMDETEALETFADVEKNEDEEFPVESNETKELETVMETVEHEEMETATGVEGSEKIEFNDIVEKIEESEKDTEAIAEDVESENIDEPAKLAELVQAVAMQEKTILEDDTMSEEKDVISINSEKEEVVEEKDFNIVDETDTETTYITKGTIIVGDIESDGSVDIIGTVDGNITCKGKVVVGGTVDGNITSGELYANNAKITGAIKSYGSVKVGVGSVLVGNIEGESAVIAGAVNGDIDVQGPVIVDSTAVIMGNIKSRSVQINNGAVIEGFCSQTYSDIDVKSFFE